MKLWLLDCNVDEFENLTWADNINIDEVQTFDGRSKINNWQPLILKRMYYREFSNTPGLSAHIPVFDKRAVLALEDLLYSYAEILPVECSDGEFYVINVTEVLDCIDYKESVYKTFRDGKRVMHFIKYAFFEQMVMGKHIFKIVDEPLRRPFVSDEFRKRVIENNLTGFTFDLAWDSEA